MLPAYLTLSQTKRTSYKPKLKAFADDKLHVTQNIAFAFNSVENIVGKGENADYQHFHPFPTTF